MRDADKPIGSRGGRAPREGPLQAVVRPQLAVAASFDGIEKPGAVNARAGRTVKNRALGQAE